MSNQNLMSLIFEDARTHRFFSEKPVPGSLLKTLYDTVKFAPSASNTCPMRILFVTSDPAKAKLMEAVGDGNKPKVQTAPVIAVVAHDMEFYKYLGTLAPHLDADSFAAQGEDKLRMQANNNTWLAGWLSDSCSARIGSGLWSDVWVQPSKGQRAVLCRQQLARQLLTQSWLW